MNRKTEVIENKEVWRKKNVSFLRSKNDIIYNILKYSV